MKRTIILLSFLAGAALMLAALEGCKGPEGPAGPAGSTTVVNLEGFAPGIKCTTCHDSEQDTTYYMRAREFQWALSKHSYGGDYDRNANTCAGCHTTEGFQQRVRGETVTAHNNATPPGCFACHSPHARNNFSLRISTPVTVKSNIIGVADASFNYGKGNLCAMCHQTRDMNPKPDPTKSAVTDTITISSNRWYSHYGVQSQVLMGTGGFQFTSFTYTGNSFHTGSSYIQQEGCVACHMADAPAGTGIAGGHTMNLRYDQGGTARSLLTGCNRSGCHSPALTTLDYNGVQTTVDAYLDTLETMMLDTAVVNKFNAGAKKAWITVATDGSITINASTGSPLKIRPASRSGALYNFLLIEHDLSEGVHNARYVTDLLKSSVEELRKP